MAHSTYLRQHIGTSFQAISLWFILIVHALLLGRISAINAPMFDEIAHVPAGLSHWKFGKFELYRVNPPLMRMIASAPLLLFETKTDWAFVSSPYNRPEFSVGRRFIELNSTNSAKYFTMCRWAQIPVSMFGGWICFRWARDLFGVPSGFVSLLLWATCPTVLAWGSTITPDIGAAAFGVAAAYGFWKWLLAPNWKSCLTAGCLMGLAELTKSTWVILFVLWPLIWLMWRMTRVGNVTPTPRVLQLGAILGVALYIINIGYGFENTCNRLSSFSFISRSLGGVAAHDTPGNRFRKTWLGFLPLPLPANYVCGIDIQKYDFEVGKWSYLRGEQKRGGWWYYYLYAFMVKTPTGALAILSAAAICAASRSDRGSSLCNEVVLLLPAMALFTLVSSQTGFSRYLRYILPSLPFFFIFAGRVGKWFETKHAALPYACAALLTLPVIESLSVFPHSISFFNIISGGPLRGPEHLLDANVDWGQDLILLKHFVERHPGIHPLYIAYFGYADARHLGLQYEAPLSPDRGIDIDSLRPGWYAVSVNHVFGYRHQESDAPTFAAFRQIKPDRRIGYSILLYHITGAVDDEGKGSKERMSTASQE